MKLIRNKWIPWQGYKYIILFGYIFTRSKTFKIEDIKPKELNHESIHARQGKYLLWIFFYLWYVIEWIFKFIISCFSDKADDVLDYTYKSVSFEQEAYYNQGNLDYLNIHKPYTWIKYIFKMYDKNKLT